MKKTAQALVVIALFTFLAVPPMAAREQILVGAVKNSKNYLEKVFFASGGEKYETKHNPGLELKERKEIKILIVPGHDKESGGTRFRNIKESSLNAELGERIYNLLKGEKEFKVYLVRGKSGYLPEFLSYFNDQKESIKQFEFAHQKVTNYYERKGLITDKEWIVHNSASPDAANKLYGINKWANENDVDVVLHIHFNDYPRRNLAKRGKYSGFSIYIPEKQFSNSKKSIALAKSVFDRLKKKFAISNLPKEKMGIIEDQKLIAVGSYNTLNAASLLIEYGYIYERQFTSPTIRKLVLQRMAKQTFLGVKNFFQRRKNNSDKEDEEKLVHKWGRNLRRGMNGNADVFFLQTALAEEGLYPPEGRSKNSCPINGNFGPCTLKAVIDFQKSYGIKPAVGKVGPLTRAKLNEIYF